MKTILLSVPADSSGGTSLEPIEALAPDARVVVTERREEMESVLDEVEIAAGFVPADLVARATRLRWYQHFGAGADWLLRHPEVAAKDFVLTNVSGLHAIPITEHILAFLLAFARKLPDSIRAQERHDWLRVRDLNAVFELAGKTMLVVGAGAIGRRTAEIASAMGMRVLGVRRSAAAGVPGFERMGGREALPDFLPQADFVVVTVPLTSETRGMIGSGELRLMKPTAYLVNIGRGGTVDEGALIQALREGRLAGAGLDVFETEPLPADSPFWDMPNVVITAHYSGITPHYGERAMAIFAENLRRYQAGEPLLHVVNKELGY